MKNTEIEIEIADFFEKYDQNNYFYFCQILFLNTVCGVCVFRRLKNI